MPPTLLDLRTSVARDIRDPNFKTFSAPYVDDLINAGIEEVGRLYPVEKIQVIDVVPGTYDYTVALDNAFRLEIWTSAGQQGVMDEALDDSQSGWDLFAGQLHLPKGALTSLTASHDLKLWGYAQRKQLAADGDVSDLDSTAEWGVRRYARSQAFTAMNNDRALFKQWQGQNQNTDVSANMLNQMVSLYGSEWDRQRNYLRRLRRI